MSPFSYVLCGVVIGWLCSSVADVIIQLLRKRKKKKKDQFVFDEKKDVIQEQDIDS